MKQPLSVLGSTGSIGTQTLDVARGLGLKICALAAEKNVALLERQIREFHPQVAAVFDPAAAKQLKTAVRDLPVRVVQGMDGLCEAACLPTAGLVCNSVVGMVGLKPTLAAVRAGKNVALSNKETLVAGGALVMREAEEHHVKILPVDSEHSAVFQCLQGSPGKRAVRRIILTASGGPFFGKSSEALRDVTPEQALKHPNWHMGPKVTIDSATMMNKGLEVIEASRLFDVADDRIDVLVQRESVIHSMVEFQDRSVIAQMGVPDMRLPIQYAITWPERLPSQTEELDLAAYGTLSFARPDEKTFRCLAACRRALRRGGLAPAAANGANEAAVKLFLDHRISFCEIGDLVWEATERQPDVEQVKEMEEILEADARARSYVYHTVNP
ncbi:1-deoxy-D-xylulose-5-phosphate reductoisomerase [Caproiciproducens sp. NJN-50]|uniref:1-deoxy-D-xylulose-5-phosphate reductoisomerase n=1 Tax=Acutalibacteraceae TaxID=3082771 RepID=UPI000FFE2B64|nr:MULTISPECIES: 1-deoxy-D-xylulose-5-phosphate reductoisomerase [Acutalibacteraceae]QAT49747.1 1-deoxy-D-xylulose-5-phosphate reductoisomerase [Caproiciproducens sp. NJN-50]